MNIIEFKGGLGNQMFQYSFLKYLEKGSIVLADLSNYIRLKFHDGFELDKVLSKNELSHLSTITNSKKKSFYVRVISKFIPTKYTLALKNSYFEDPTSAFIENIFKVDNVYFSGFWRNKEYVERISAKSIFSFPNEQILLKKLTIPGPNSCFIHIRRGDYLLDENLGNICDLSYYMKCVEQIKERVHIDTFFIFSDDIPWCKKELKLKNCIYVSGNPSYVDLMLMSNCRHAIISNSTFSWWGAYLRKNPGLTFCPKVWNRSNYQNNLLLDDWISF